jgi:uncharacterized membrane protein
MAFLSLIPLILLVSLLAPFVVIAMLISLYSRVNKLERIVNELSARRGATPVPPAPGAEALSGVPMTHAVQMSATPLAVSVSSENRQTAMPVIAPAAAVVAPPQQEDKFVKWIKENWLLKLGALLLLIGLGWFVSYAFLNNWIGPVGRITLGLFIGTSILALGFWRMRSFLTQGSVFVILGATTILLTTYASRAIYDFFTPLSALGLMLAACALVAFTSGVYNRKQLAVASVLMAGIAPMFTHSATTDYVSLFWYLLVVIIGAIWIVVWRDFREVVTTALVVVGLYSAPLLLHVQSADLSTLLLFAYAFAAIFYISHTSGLVRLKGDTVPTDLITAVLNALLLIAWIYVAAEKDWQSLIVSVWAVAFVFGAYAVFRASGRREAIVLYSAIGVGYIAAATAMQLHGEVLTIAFTLEAAAVSMSIYILSRDIAAAQRAALLLIVPGLLTLQSFVAREWLVGVFNKHFFVLAVFASTLFILGEIFREDTRSASMPDVRKGNAWLFILASVYAYILLWLSLHAALPQNSDTATMGALIIYTLIGIATYLYGLEKGSYVLKTYGGILLALVVGRLLIVDVWQMQLTGRIITFCLIGALLMSTAFLGRKKKDTA